jgi:predicted transcriptional regulator
MAVGVREKAEGRPPGRRGHVLTPFEAEVLAAVRRLGKAGAAEVRAALGAEGHLHPYTTVASALQRLYGRGLLLRDSERVRGGRRFTFRLSGDEDDDAELVDRMTEAFGESAVLHLLDASEGRAGARLRQRLHQDP